jgi:hypothetical protein
MIAFYYGLTGFACVWFYRHHLGGDARSLLMKGVLPFLGGVILLTAFVIACYQYAQPDYGNTTIAGIGGVFVLGIGSLLLGVVLLLVYRGIAPAFFRGETLSRRSARDLVLAEGGAEGPSLRLPDSGLPGIVIAPDRSNLPPGSHVADQSVDDDGEETDRR